MTVGPFIVIVETASDGLQYPVVRVFPGGATIADVYAWVDCFEESIGRVMIEPER